MITLASLTNIAGPDVIVILLIVLVLFGAKKLPELARGMGQAVKEFHKARDEFGQELASSETRTPPPAAPIPAPAITDRSVEAKPVEPTVIPTAKDV